MAINGALVLLLEDEPLISMDLETVLSAAGLDVTTVMSCIEANAWLDRQSPDVVIVDIELRDGPCTAVLARVLDANIPFVVHTGSHPSYHAGTLFERGAWVEKPATPDELLQAVKAALNTRNRPDVSRDSAIKDFNPAKSYLSRGNATVNQDWSEL